MSADDDVLAWIDECLTYDDQGPALSRRTAGQLARWAQSQLDAAVATPTPADPEPVEAFRAEVVDILDGGANDPDALAWVDDIMAAAARHLAGRAGVSPQPETTPGKAWAERMRASLTEILDADEVARLRAKGSLGLQETHLLCDSHEKLRTGPQPEITRQQIAVRLHKALLAGPAITPHQADACVDHLTDEVWALLADGATPADPDLAEVVAAKRAEIDEWERHQPPLPPRRAPDPTVADACTCGHRRDEHSRIDGECYERVDVEQWCPCRRFVGATPAGPAPGKRCTCTHLLTSHSYWDKEDGHLTCNEEGCDCTGYTAVTPASPDPYDPEWCGMCSGGPVYNADCPHHGGATPAEDDRS